VGNIERLSLLFSTFVPTAVPSGRRNAPEARKEVVDVHAVRNNDIGPDRSVGAGVCVPPSADRKPVKNKASDAVNSLYLRQGGHSHSEECRSQSIRLPG